MLINAEHFAVYCVLGYVCVPKLNHNRSGTRNSNTFNSKFHFIQIFCEIFARFLSFHV